MGLKVTVDIGGTFTDLVSLDESSGKIRISKDPTTPSNLFQGVMNCIRKAEIDPKTISSFVHGSTIAINALLEKKGARACLVATKGFRDIFEIGRGQRADMFNPLFRKPEPLISRANVFEIAERVGADGEVLLRLQPKEVSALGAKIAAGSYDSVAICLVNAYANPGHEAEIAKALRKRLPGVTVCPSYELTREYREYERTSTVAINAYITPIVKKHLTALEDTLRTSGCRGQLLMMQSNGGVMSFNEAKSNAISMIESGPSSGVVGASELGKLLGYGNIISFDMGGTTAKASLIERGEPKYTVDYSVSGLPILIPFIDLVEVGAGGGSIAWTDVAGGLRVGPRSAGSNPGPACYGWGGEMPTVTDANLHVGHLNPDFFLGGEIQLSPQRALKAIKEKVADPLGMDVDYCALGILKVANTIMANAIRAVTIEKGYDPRDFTLVAYGGAGPVHVSSLAQILEVPRILVPQNPAHFSAVGMLLANLQHDYAQTYVIPLADLSLKRITADLDAMGKKGVDRLAREKVPTDSIVFMKSLDMRYLGQEHTLSVSLGDSILTGDWRQNVADSFHRLHDMRYGHSAPGEPLEVVNLRLTAIGPAAKPEFTKVEPGGRTPPTESHRGTRRVSLLKEDGSTEAENYDVYRRERMMAENTVDGPAIIEEYASTTLVLSGYRALIDRYGNISISIKE